MPDNGEFKVHSFITVISQALSVAMSVTDSWGGGNYDVIIYTVTV